MSNSCMSDAELTTTWHRSLQPLSSPHGHTHNCSSSGTVGLFVCAEVPPPLMALLSNCVHGGDGLWTETSGVYSGQAFKEMRIVTASGGFLFLINTCTCLCQSVHWHIQHSVTWKRFYKWYRLTRYHRRLQKKSAQWYSDVILGVTRVQYIAGKG